MGRANRGKSGGSVLREDPISQAGETLGIGDLDYLREDLHSGSIDSDRIRSLALRFDGSFADAVYRGDVHQMARSMEYFDPQFQSEQFLEEVLNEDGSFAEDVDEDDYRQMLIQVAESSVDIDYAAAEYLQDTTGRGEIDHSDEEFRNARQEVLSAIVDSPNKNSYRSLAVPNVEEWIYEENKEALARAWYRAGGTHNILEYRINPMEMFEKTTGLKHSSDVDVSVFEDSGSDTYFINQKSGNFYGNRRSYVMTINDEDRNVDVLEARNEDGRVLQLRSHGLQVTVVETASNGSVEYERSGGRHRAEANQLHKHADLESFALHLLEEEVRISKHPESQASRLFETFADYRADSIS